MKYHPSYGLAFDLHEQVVAYADDHGIKAASQHYNIGVSTIYRWRYNLRR
jgi:transposase